MSLLSDEKINDALRGLPMYASEWDDADFHAFARAIAAAVLEAQGKQEPVAEVMESPFGATIDPVGKAILHVGQSLYAAPVVQPDMVLVPREQVEAVQSYISKVKLAQKVSQDQPISMLFACGCLGPLPECFCAKRSRLVEGFMVAAAEGKK